jgi:hypothetical protein
MNEIENKENESCAMRQMLETVKENIKVAEKALNDKDNEIQNEKELLTE